MLPVKQIPYFVKKLGLLVFYLSLHGTCATRVQAQQVSLPWTTGETPPPPSMEPGVGRE